MKKHTDDGATPDPLALSIWEGFSELTDWPDIASNVDEALRSLEDFRAQQRAERRKTIKTASMTAGALVIVCMAVGSLLGREGMPGEACPVQAAPVSGALEAKGGKHVFAGAAMADVVAEMNRNARRPIVLAGHWQGDYRLTADMCLGDTDKLATLLMDWGLAQKVEVTTDAIVLTATCQAGCAALQAG